MSIILVGPSLTQRGGVVSVIKTLKNFLSSHNITVRTIATTTEGGKIKNLVAFLNSWASIIRICIFNKGFVIHLHVASRGSCLRKSILALTCWLFRNPYVVHLHGGKFNTFYAKELGYLGRSLVNFVFRKADSVIALSNTWKTWLDESIKPKRTTVIFNGVPACEIVENPIKTPTVLFLGRLCANKGTAELISAMREVVKSVPDAILELGGDGDIDLYKQLAADIPNIIFLGWVNDEARKEALTRASIYCLPSWNEGLPMSVLEAMSAALPVISTPVGGIPEAVEHGKTGLLVNPGDVNALADALVSLLMDSTLATEMGIKGQESHRERFSSESMGERCLEVYASCMKK